MNNGKTSEENTEILFETERLEFRKITLEDAPFMYMLMNSDGWLKNIGDRNISSVEAAEDFIEKNCLNSYHTHGYGAYMVILKETNTAVGNCGLYKRKALDFPDIGFAFLPQYVQKGFGYEASCALMNFARTNFRINKIYGLTIRENIASIRLLEKLGLRKSGTIQLPNDPQILLLYST
jgi:ribosomal-protein-alanine N-acetyltransferase